MRVLYVDVDTLRPDHLGCYGYHRNTSPNIDEIATEGRRFTNYYATDAPCLPSRTALFTGRFGIHTGLIDHDGLNANPRPLGRQRGFGSHGPFKNWIPAIRETGMHTAQISAFPNRHAAHHIVRGFHETVDPGDAGLSPAHEVFPHADDWLSENAADDDWFLHVNFWDPHMPYDTPEDFGNPFEDDPAPEWLTDEMIQEQRDSYGLHGAHEPYGMGDSSMVSELDFFERELFPNVRERYDWWEGGLPRMPDEIRSREEFEQWIDGYDVGIRYMDKYVGKLFDRLREEGVFEDTLVIVSADHGENQGELNVYGAHEYADDKTCRVPLIIRGPGAEPGVDGDLHYNLDLTPTITEYVGGEPDPRWDGQSFLPSLESGADAGRDQLVISTGVGPCQRGVRWDDWLLIRTYHDGYKDIDEVMLFDLAEDPHETTDLSDRHPEVVDEGLARLHDWHTERMLESATNEKGGNPDAPRGVTDPMWEVVREGPNHTRGTLEPYLERLRDTGREEQARELEAQYLDD